MNKGVVDIESPYYSLYVDGSCLENMNVTKNTLAGWGIVVIKGDSHLGKGKGEIIFEKSGLVITEPSLNEYMGAEVGSNNTGELSAIAYALRWLLMNDGEHVVEICTDSTYAGNIASGAWRAKANKKLAATVQELWKEVSSQQRLTWRHVRAHRGHKWNERADHLAVRAVQRKTPEPLSFWKPGMR
jgi:ribonuclease HI